MMIKTLCGVGALYILLLLEFDLVSFKPALEPFKAMLKSLRPTKLRCLVPSRDNFNLAL